MPRAGRIQTRPPTLRGACLNNAAGACPMIGAFFNLRKKVLIHLRPEKFKIIVAMEMFRHFMEAAGRTH